MVLDATASPGATSEPPAAMATAFSDAAGGYGDGAGYGPGDADDRRWALLAVGDRSARRSEQSPDWDDPEAFAFDDAVIAALTCGDGRALFDLDRTVGHRVLAGGIAAWHDAGSIHGPCREGGSIDLAPARQERSARCA